MNQAYDYSRRLLSKAGSFWVENLSEVGRDKARMLTQVGDLGRYFEPLEAAMAGLTGGSWVYDYNVDVLYRPTEVEMYGTLPPVVTVEGVPVFVPPTASAVTLPATPQSLVDQGQERVDGTVTLPDPLGSATVLPKIDATGTAYYGLRLPPEIAPLRITSPVRGMLLINRDFYVRNNVLLFKEHPSNLFRDSVIPVAACRRSVFSINGAFMGVDRVYGPTEQIALYHRYNHSIAQWLAAACQAASIGVFNFDSMIRGIVPLERGCIYITDAETVTCDYPHTQLNIGDFVKASQIPGDVISFEWAKFKTQEWWTNTFPQGIELGNLCAVSGLTVPSDGMAVTYQGSASATEMHVGLQLLGDPAKVAQYNNLRKILERNTGRYTWRALNLPLTPTSTPIGTILAVVDGVQFFLTWLLGSRMVVITEKLSDAGTLRHDRLLTFLNNHKPTGCIPLIVSE